jgi:DNA topoisomerase-1
LEEVTVAPTRARWQTLVHKGVAFPPAYQPRGITVSIRGKKVALNADQEELVYAWAKKKDTHYVQDPVFQGNFLSDLKPLLPDEFKNIADLKMSDFDFTEAFQLADEEKVMKEREKERIKNLPREEKKKMAEAKKAERERLKAIYGKAIVDGKEVEIANWLVEPPGLFMGRGQHPLRGRWKPRVRPQDVTLNMGEDIHPEGEWKEIVHDHTSTWLATWIERLTDKRMYVWLHDSSELRQGNDKAKYDKALKLAQQLPKIEKEVIRKMKGSSDKAATVAYLIFKMAMRVGDEKDPDEADTVGASTLRVEHIKFPQRADGRQQIEFNFLGKDSVPWQKTLDVVSEDTKALHDNLRNFMKGKKPDERIFGEINSRKVNEFFQTIMPGLTAKVFRTCIATKVVQEALVNPPVKVDKNSGESEKIYVAKAANLKAAIECNHKKGVDPKNPAAKKAMEKFEATVASRKEAIANLEKEVAQKNWKTEAQEKRLKERLEKLKVQLKLQQETRDYNLGTSLRNYIDPRVMKAWLNYVELDWTKVYTSTLQRKFKWVEGYKDRNFRLYP